MNAKDNWIVDILVLNLSGVDFGVIALEYFWEINQLNLLVSW